MLSLDEAKCALRAELDKFVAQNTSKELEEKLLSDCLGSVLAKDIFSSIDVPPADNSAMDGYAINTNDLRDTNTLTISQRIPAGARPLTLKENTAARIFTGAEIPKGADAVVMQENCTLVDDDSVCVNQTPSPNTNIRAQGQDIAKGSCVLKSGTRLGAEHLALLASIGVAKINTFKPLRVGIFSTGDELVEPGQALQAGQIYNSNQTMIETLLKQMYCEVSTYKAVNDTFEETCEVLRTASKNVDLVISTGGVSVGEEDHVKSAVKSLGSLNLWKVNIKPGKPFAFGAINASVTSTLTTSTSTDARYTPFIGLPGNPVSAYVTFLLLAKNIIRILQGEEQKPLQSFSLPAGFSITRETRRPEYIRVRFDKGHIERFPNQSSGVLSSVCWAQGLALIPAGTLINEGDLLDVYPWEFI